MGNQYTMLQAAKSNWRPRLAIVGPAWISAISEAAILDSGNSHVLSEVAYLIEFGKSEERFLKKNELGRLATISPDGMPHVVPVSYIYHDGKLLVATDYGTKKYRNLVKNDRAALVVDVYRPNRGVLVQGEGRIVEAGPEFREAYELFYKKFSWVRADPWKEREAPFIKIAPIRKVSWGLASK